MSHKSTSKSGTPSRKPPPGSYKSSAAPPLIDNRNVQHDAKTQTKKSTSIPSNKGVKGVSDVKPSVVEPFLTPEQRHYLLKVLVCAEMHDEWTLLDEAGGLQQYGAPFVDGGSKAPKNAGQIDKVYGSECTTRPLILLHMFHVHLRRFPGLDQAKVEYWRKHIVPVFDKIVDGRFSTSAERSEVTERRLVILTATRYLSTFWSRGVAVRGRDEERGPGKGGPGSAEWGVGKQWGRGTVKRGLSKPLRPSREEMSLIDQLFADDEHDSIVWKTAAANTRRVKRDWSAWKESIIESEEGLDSTLKLLQTKAMMNLPAPYRNAAEWVRRHVAFVAWTVLVKFPGGDDLFAIIKTIHALFPYWGAKQLLKIANAQTMIKAIIDMVLARPLGAIDSLGQRIFFTVVRSEIDFINRKFLTPLRKAIANEEACKVLDDYVSKRTSRDRDEYMIKAKDRGCDLLIVIMEAHGYQHIDMLYAWQNAFVSTPYAQKLDWAYPDVSREARHIDPPPKWVEFPSGTSGENALSFARLKLYLREKLRRHDWTKIMEIGTGPLIPTAIRASLEAVFYKLLHEIACSSDLSARLGDLQAFVDDLIRVKTQKKDDLQDWIALAARHEDNLYLFVHEIRDAIKPVFDWCQEALDFMALATTEPWQPSNHRLPRVEIDLDAMVMDATQGTSKTSRGDTASEPADFDAIMKELRAVEDYIRWDKIHTELAMRQEYALIRDDAVTSVTLTSDEKGSPTPARDVQSANARRLRPSSAMTKRLKNLDALMKELLEDAGIQPDNGTIPLGGVRGSDTSAIPWGYFMPDDILFEKYGDDVLPKGQERSYFVNSNHVPPPTTHHIRQLLPKFREHLSKGLPDWVNRARG